MPGTPLNLRLGKYAIHEELGRGGFGAVYRATDTSLSRVVAIKMLLYYETSGNQVGDRCQGAMSCRIEYTGPAGLYYVYIYATGNYNSTTPYTLRVSYP